jgi:aminoglycoside/choline kinase family phosphotransferase
MTLSLSAQRALRLDRCLLKIELGTPTRSSPEKQIKNLIDLYIALLRAEKHKQLDTDLSIAMANASIARDIAQFITLDPVMKRIKLAIKALLKGDVEKGLEILNKIVADKKKMVSDIQAGNRKNRKQDTAYNALLRRIIKAEPQMSQHIFKKRVLEEKGNGVITNINTVTNTITTKDGFSHSISGLKDRFYDIKNSL